jgi:hypothetical protein
MDHMPRPSAAHDVERRTFVDNVRRMFRRQPDMADEPVDLSLALALSAGTLFIGAAFGVGWILLVATVPTIITTFSFMPILMAHVEGVRHRWWALAAGAAAALGTGLPVGGLLSDTVGPAWAGLIAILASSLVAVVVHAAVTHLRRGRAAR